MTEQKLLLTSSQASFKNGVILGLFAFVSTGLIAITHLITKDKIAVEVEKAMANRLNQLIAKDLYSNDFYQDCIKVNDAALLNITHSKVYRMRKNNNDIALTISSVAPDGYAGNIKLVIGIYHDGTLAGVRVTDHKETPGLGDKIEIKKSDWIKQFDGRSLSNLPSDKWAVNKDGGDFNALTGATITPRSIINSVHRALIYFKENKEQLFSEISNCGVKK